MRRKLLISFFITYTVLLLTQPCEDFQAAWLEINSQQKTSSISDPIRSDNQSGPESCSPFCVCGCCGLTVLHHEFATLAITDRITAAETTPTAIYQSPSNRTFADSIWQPPKV